MNPEQPFSTSPNPSPLYSALPPKPPKPYLLIATIIFGAGTLIFGIMAATFYTSAKNTRNTAASRQAQAVENARKTQKIDDDLAYEKIAGSPFRSYTAPVAYGSFEVSFPKHWSSYVEEQSSGTQIYMRINPEFLRRTNGTVDKDAVHVSLIDQPASSFLKSYDGQIKLKNITKESIKVAGLDASSLTGKFSDKRTVRTVVIPVRDKVIVFSSEDQKYASEFNEILAQAKIVP